MKKILLSSVMVWASLFYAPMAIANPANSAKTQTVNQQFDQRYAQWSRTQTPTKTTISTAAASPSSKVTSSTKINLNTATVAELQQLSGVGEAKAKAIIAYRKKQGGFKSIDELKQVKGIGEALFQKNKARLTL